MSPEPSVHKLAEALADFGAKRRAAAVEAGDPVKRPSEKRPAPEEGTLVVSTPVSRPASPGGPRAAARLRTTPAMRRMVAETRLHPAELILPAFVREGISEPVPVSSMPGVVQHTRDTLRRPPWRRSRRASAGIMLFGVPEGRRTRVGTQGTDPDGILQVALRDVRAEVGDDLVVMSDLCLDEFTDHGHCGVLDARGRVDNDATLERYAEMARVQADAGAHVVGPERHDGRPGRARPRARWTRPGHQDVSILAYTAKYASAFYGPFREAVDSSLKGDRKTYQQDPANARESLRELALDLAEGADMVMVKPGLPYLDVLRDVAERVDVPRGVVPDLRRVRDGRGRRGERLDRPRPRDHGDADRLQAGRARTMILTYWATEVASGCGRRDSPARPSTACGQLRRQFVGPLRASVGNSSITCCNRSCR